MAVLGDAAGQEYRERDYPGSEKGHEYHMWTRLRNNADKGSKKYHQSCIVTDPVVDVYVMHNDSKHQQDTESPCEYRREMFPDDMVPEVFLHEMVLGEYQYDQHDHAESCKKHVHPVLAQKIDRFLHALRLVEMTSAFAMVMMGMSVMVMSVTRHCEGFARGNLFTFMNMTLMSGVVMSQHSRSQCGNEKRQTHQHAYSFPSEMPQIATLRSQ